MSATLKIDNYGSLNIKATTELDLDAAAGSASLTVQDALDYNINDYGIIGQLGGDLSELVQISAIAAQVFTLAANTKLDHKRFDGFTSLFGNKIKVYRAPNVNGTTPADNTFALLATIDIDTDQLSTTYTDTSGGSTYWYKFTYYNSTLNNETDISDSAAARGGGYGHYATIDQIRTEAGFQNNQNITDAQVNSYRIDAEDEIDSQLGGIYNIPFAAPVPPVVTNITKLLAAGYLLYADYGAMGGGTNKEAAAKIKDAREMISRLQARSMTLTDQNGNSLVVQAAVTSWPDNSTSGLGEYNDDGTFAHGGDTMFQIAKKF